jgi:hypothetical protein
MSLVGLGRVKTFSCKRSELEEVATRANIASQAKEVLGVDELEAVADRGYYSGEEILACDKAGTLGPGVRWGRSRGDRAAFISSLCC